MRNSLFKLTNLAIIGGLLLVSLLIYRAGQQRPYQAADLPAEQEQQTTHISGTVTNVGEQYIEVTVAGSDGFTVYTVLVTPATAIFEFGSNNLAAQLSDIRVGDGVEVTPTADGSGYTREAANIDLFKK